MTTAVAMKTRVAAIERGDPRPMPQTPWPLVHPAPAAAEAHEQARGDEDTERRVEADGRQRTAEGSGTAGCDQQADEEGPMPANLAVARVQQAAQDTADACNASVEHQQQGRGRPDQDTADESGNRGEVFRQSPANLAAAAERGGSAVGITYDQRAKARVRCRPDPYDRSPSGSRERRSRSGRP